MNDELGYFKDRLSGVVLKVAGAYDVKQMRIHPDYIEVTEDDYKKYAKIK
jgi:hypothetical protein